MVMAYGPEHLTVTMNGHEVQGWANVADFFMPPQDTEFFGVKIGPLGDAFYYRKGAARGGEVKIVLMPNSESTTFFDQQAQVVAQGGFVEWNGTARNSANNKSLTMESGVLRRAPKGEQFGDEEVAAKTYIFYFQDIV